MVTGGLVLAVLAEPLIVLLYGSAFQPSAAVLQLLLPGFVISGVAATLGSYFTGTGRARIFLFLLPGPVALQLLLAWILMPQWGLKGAALAISIGQAVYGVVLVLYFKHETKAPFNRLLSQWEDVIYILDFITIWMHTIQTKFKYRKCI